MFDDSVWFIVVFIICSCTITFGLYQRKAQVSKAQSELKLSAAVKSEFDLNSRVLDQDTVAALLGHDGISFLDVRADATDFDKAHIDNAQWLPFNSTSAKELTIRTIKSLRNSRMVVVYGWSADVEAVEVTRKICEAAGVNAYSFYVNSFSLPHLVHARIVARDRVTHE